MNRTKSGMLDMTRIKLLIFSLLAVVAGPFLDCTAHAQQTGGSAVMVNSPEPQDICSVSQKKITEAEQKLAAGCSKSNGSVSDKATATTCKSNIIKCMEKNKAAADDALQTDGTNADDCQTFSDKGCQDTSSSTEELQSDKKHADKDRKELQKQIDDNQKANVDAMKASQDQMNQLDDKSMQDDQQYQKDRIAASRTLEDGMKKIDDDKAKAVQAAQQKYDEINVQYIKMRDELRRKTSKASNLKLSWNVKCRAAANDAGRQAETDMDTRMAKEDTMIINSNLASASGRNNRRLQQKRQKILDQYNITLSRCLKGEQEPGTSTKLALDDTLNDVSDSTKQANDQQARLEGLRTQIIQNLQGLQQSTDKETAMLATRSAQDIQMLDQNHMTSQFQQQSKKMQAMQQQQAQAMQQAQQTKSLNDQMNDAKEAETAASTHLKCGTSSKDEVSSTLKAQNDAIAGATMLDSACRDFTTNACMSQKTPTGGKFGKHGTCYDLRKAKDAAGADKPIDPTSSDIAGQNADKPLDAAVAAGGSGKADTQQSLSQSGQQYLQLYTKNSTGGYDPVSTKISPAGNRTTK